jgi:hypothetical protein
VKIVDNAKQIDVPVPQDPERKNYFISEVHSDKSLDETSIDGNEVNKSTLSTQPEINLSSDGMNFFFNLKYSTLKTS